MRGRKNLYKIVDQNGRQAFEDLFDCTRAAEKIGTTKRNVYQAVENYALVNKKYRIIPEDIKLSRDLDATLLLEWDRWRTWLLRAAGREA